MADEDATHAPLHLHQMANGIAEVNTGLGDRSTGLWLRLQLVNGVAEGQHGHWPAWVTAAQALAVAAAPAPAPPPPQIACQLRPTSLVSRDPQATAPCGRWP
jgi:hypothetical protein